MYSLPQAGLLANNFLASHLEMLLACGATNGARSPLVLLLMILASKLLGSCMQSISRKHFKNITTSPWTGLVNFYVESL
ncbi:hypothetical protein ACHAW6_005092 [Cyclotella cf. meneghiniana]